MSATRAAAAGGVQPGERRVVQRGGGRATTETLGASGAPAVGAVSPEGDAGLIHGLRGKPGNAGQAQGRAQVLALYRRKYLEFGPAHAADMMARQEKRVGLA